MFKKIFKAATAFTLLVGCYLGYAQVFALVVGQLTTVRRPEIVLQHRRLEIQARFDQTRQSRDASWPLGNQE